MAENLMVGSHKSTNAQYRENWERTFGKEEYFDTKDAKYTVHFRCSQELAKKLKKHER